MSILSDHDIMLRIASGNLAISDLDESMIQPASVDLKLGKGFLIPRHDVVHLDGTARDSLDNEIVRVGPHWLRPQMFCLGTTLENVKIPHDLVARVEGKSSLGRLGLCVHATAGFIDPGFEGQLTLEFYNMSNSTIVLYPGQPICQLAFEELSTPAKRPYGTPGLGSKYQGQKGVTGSRLQETDSEKCDRPPPGWYCTRKAPHDGPCAALPNVPFGVGDRVYHRRADMFGSIKAMANFERMSVKYEWPYDPAAEPVEVPFNELVHATEAPSPD